MARVSRPPRLTDPLNGLTLSPTATGFDLTLDGERLGRCALDGTRLLVFEVAPDQRRRGVGRQAMALLLDSLPSDARIEIEIPAGDTGARLFSEAVGFGVKSLVVDRRAKRGDETVELFRPVGQTELQLIETSGMRAFPPRLPDQPIFYPVATIEYARLIAKELERARSAFRLRGLRLSGSAFSGSF